MKIPSLILRQLYTFGSLENEADGVRFRLKNRLSDATLVRIGELKIDGKAVPLDSLTLDLGGGERMAFVYIPAGEGNRHKAKALTNVARLVFAEKI